MPLSRSTLHSAADQPGTDRQSALYFGSLRWFFHLLGARTIGGQTSLACPPAPPNGKGTAVPGELGGDALTRAPDDHPDYLAKHDGDRRQFALQGRATRGAASGHPCNIATPR